MVEKRLNYPAQFRLLSAGRAKRIQFGAPGSG
jgi:hypothetical protein